MSGMSCSGTVCYHCFCARSRSFLFSLGAFTELQTSVTALLLDYKKFKNSGTHLPRKKPHNRIGAHPRGSKSEEKLKYPELDFMLKLAILKVYFKCKDGELVDFDTFLDFGLGNNSPSAGGSICFHHMSNAELVCA